MYNNNTFEFRFLYKYSRFVYIISIITIAPIPQWLSFRLPFCLRVWFG